MSLINSKSKKENQEKVISFGLATFNSEFEKFFPQDIKRRYEKIFSQKQWSLQSKNYSKTNWSRWFSYMRATKAEIIAFKSANLHQKFLRDISQIEMQNLRQIDLRDNLLTNIENLTFLFAPKLEIIHLNDNKIMNATKTISKFDFKNLLQIGIGNNPVHEIDMGRVMSLRQKGFMISYSVTFSHMGGSKCTINDLSAFAKIKNMNQSFRQFSNHYTFQSRVSLNEIGIHLTIVQKKCLNALIRNLKENKHKAILVFRF